MMVLSDVSHGGSPCYRENFWSPELESTHGAELLSKRNHESKRMCQDLEDYLKKRAKIESDYSKSLAGLTKCFRQRDDIGVLEASFSALRDELVVMSQSHLTCSEHLHKLGEGVRSFREEQTASRKSIEDSLQKAQQAKLSNLNKTLQTQKSYVKKSVERDQAELACNGLQGQQTAAKDLDKLKSKAAKCDDEANKADATYKSSVMVLNGSVEHWEKEMTSACEAIQRLDVEKITELRKQLWTTLNLDSKLALDIDNSCQVVRDVLEKCDIHSELQAFITAVGTGAVRPVCLEYLHYSRLTEPDSGPKVYDYVDVTSPTSPQPATPGDSGVRTGMMQVFGTLGRKGKR